MIRYKWVFNSLFLLLPGKAPVPGISEDGDTNEIVNLDGDDEEAPVPSPKVYFKDDDGEEEKDEDEEEEGEDGEQSDPTYVAPELADPTSPPVSPLAKKRRSKEPINYVIDEPRADPQAPPPGMDMSAFIQMMVTMAQASLASQPQNPEAPKSGSSFPGNLQPAVPGTPAPIGLHVLKTTPFQAQCKECLVRVKSYRSGVKHILRNHFGIPDTAQKQQLHAKYIDGQWSSPG
jgi:hypothetical protein